MNECRRIGDPPPSGRSPLTPALVPLSDECTGSIGQGQDVVLASGQALWSCSIQPLHSVPLAAGCPVWASPLLGLPGALGPQQQKQRESSRESERLWAGPPSPCPLWPGFLPLTLGSVAGGCWARTDKGLAAWLRLIRSRANPGGNRRAGISERPQAPPPVVRTGCHP